MFKLPSLTGFSQETTSNCLSCARYIKCSDPHKSILYSCSKYKASARSTSDAFLRLYEQSATTATTSGLSNTLILPDDSGFDISKVIKKVLKSNTPISPDLKVNDSDFKPAPNFLKFCTGKDYLNQRPFLEQALLGSIIFAEYCPKCSDKKWLDRHKVGESLSTLRDRMQLLKYGICPRCKSTKSELVRENRLNYYYEAAICAGQRSGKSAWTALATSYITHWQLLLQNPNQLYGLMSSNILHGTFVALTYAQAKDTLWEPYYGYLMDSPFFQAYHGLLRDIGNRNGEEIFKLKDTFVLYRHRHLIVYPAGPDKRTLRGRTRFFASVDELGWFDNMANSSKVKVNANEVYTALQRSLLTVRAAAEKLLKKGYNHVPTGYFLNISSPSSARDKIMELVKHSVGSRKLFGVIRPTWEMNPRVTREDLSEEFRTNPVTAMRDYGAQPPLSSSPFLASKAAIENVFTEKKNPCSIAHYTKKAPDGTETRYAKFLKLKNSGKIGCLALDGGHTNNSFALVAGHLYNGRYPMLDLFVEIQPLPGIPLNYSLIYTHIISPIIKSRNIKLITADRWNSIKILDDAEEEHGIAKKQYSLKYADMQLFKSFMEDSELTFAKPNMTIDEVLAYDHSDYPKCFKNDPVSHFILQLLTVQDTGSGVIKGDQLTDDLARAAFLCFQQLRDPDNEEIFNGEEEAQAMPFSITQMGIQKGASSGVGNSSTTTSTLGAVKSRKN